MRKHCKGESKRPSLTPGGSKQLTFIPEMDVYRLIIRSKLPAALEFEEGVVELCFLPLQRQFSRLYRRMDDKINYV